MVSEANELVVELNRPMRGISTKLSDHKSRIILALGYVIGTFSISPKKRPPRKARIITLLEFEALEREKRRQEAERLREFLEIRKGI